MAFTVTKSAGKLVRPWEETPGGTLELSVMDRVPVLRCYARTLHVFNHGVEGAGVIGEALSRALVPYYPLAGRLKETAGGELQICCSGEGVWFADASTDCTLEAVKCFNDAASIPYEKLLPDGPPESEGVDPLVIMQVTEFRCGGLVMGLSFCHAICDGLGAAQFLTAVGEMARGVHQLSVAPAWHRDFLPPPPPQTKSSPPPPQLPNFNLVQVNLDITLDQINHLKRQFHESTGRTCSAFDIIAATLWSHRTIAIDLPDAQAPVTFVFFASCRHLLNPPLPKGFYGNCFFPVTITAPSQVVAKGRADISVVVKLIQEAKAELPTEFANWMKGNYAAGGADPFAPPLSYATLFMSDWGRLGFNQIDYGWGPPAYVIPVQGSRAAPASVLGMRPLPEKGFRLMTWVVEEPHLQPLLHHLGMFQCSSIDNSA